MRNSNQYWETNEQEIVVESINPLFGDAVDENGILENQDSPTEREDELDDDEFGGEDIDEEDQSDTIEVEENYPGPKETDIGQAEPPGIDNENQENDNTDADAEDPDQESDQKRRPVDENGQRINWDKPEIPEEDSAQDSEIGDHEERPDQPGNLPDEKDVPDDANIRDLYDANPNASTIRSSNADRTFGDEKQRKNGDQGDSDRLEGENES